MFYKLTENENGEYKKDNEIVDLLKCNRAISKEGVNIGWTEFKTDEEAIKFFGLKRISE